MHAHSSWALALAGAVACTNVSSSDVKTSGLHAELTVTADAAGAAIAKAALRVGGAGGTFVDLAAGDRLTASVGGAPQPMLRRELGGAVWYEAAFSGVGADAPFVIALQRDADVSAPDSRVTLPAPFTIEAPEANAQLSRARDAIRVAWAPSGARDNVRWTVSGPCVLPAAGDVSGDPGGLVIDAGRILPLDAQAAATCPVTLELVRFRAGSLSAAYGRGGVVRAEQRRTVTVRSAP